MVTLPVLRTSLHRMKGLGLLCVTRDPGNLSDRRVSQPVRKEVNILRPLHRSKGAKSTLTRVRIPAAPCMRCRTLGCLEFHHNRFFGASHQNKCREETHMVIRLTVIALLYWQIRCCYIFDCKLSSHVSFHDSCSLHDMVRMLRCNDEQRFQSRI